MKDSRKVRIKSTIMAKTSLCSSLGTYLSSLEKDEPANMRAAELAVPQ